MSYTPLILFAAGALCLSFLCSLLEATLLSTTNAFVEVLVKKGRPSGIMLKRCKERVDRPLIAILTTNTIANMFGAAGVGAEAAKIAQHKNLDGAVYVAVASGILTFAILLCSEIVPKTLGAAYWKLLAVPAAYLIQAMVILLTPVVVLLEVVPRLITKRKPVSEITREEIAVLAELGQRAGSIPGRESQIIKNLLALSELRAHDIMTPRVEIFALHKDCTFNEAIQKHAPLKASRIPLYDKNLDHIVGIVLRHRILEGALAGKGQTSIRTIARPVFFVPESQIITRLFEEFIKRHEHIFIVVNEYGGTEGIVTLEDVVETLLGVEIVDELDTVPDLRKYALEKLAARRRLAKIHDTN